jgi:hypothetical protein
MTYLPGCIFWICLLKSMKDNKKKKFIDWIKYKEKNYAKSNILKILSKNKFNLYKTKQIIYKSEQYQKLNTHKTILPFQNIFFENMLSWIYVSQTMFLQVFQITFGPIKSIKSLWINLHMIYFSFY